MHRLRSSFIALLVAVTTTGTIAEAKRARLDEPVAALARDLSRGRPSGSTRQRGPGLARTSSARESWADTVDHARSARRANHMNPAANKVLDHDRSLRMVRRGGIAVAVGAVVAAVSGLYVALIPIAAFGAFLFGAHLNWHGPARRDQLIDLMATQADRHFIGRRDGMPDPFPYVPSVSEEDAD